MLFAPKVLQELSHSGYVYRYYDNTSLVQCRQKCILQICYNALPSCSALVSHKRLLTVKANRGKHGRSLQHIERSMIYAPLKRVCPAIALCRRFCHKTPDVLTDHLFALCPFFGFSLYRKRSHTLAYRYFFFLV